MEPKSRILHYVFVKCVQSVLDSYPWHEVLWITNAFFIADTCPFKCSCSLGSRLTAMPHCIKDLPRVGKTQTKHDSAAFPQSRKPDPNQSLTPITATLVNCDVYLFIHWHKLLSLRHGGLAGSLQLRMEEEEVISERGASSKGFTYGASGDRNAWEQYEEASVCAGSNRRRRLLLWCHEATDTIEHRNNGLMGQILGLQKRKQHIFKYYDNTVLH